MTGFESAGFDHFAISLSASRPGRKPCFHIRRRWVAIVGIARSEFPGPAVPGFNCRPAPPP